MSAALTRRVRSSRCAGIAATVLIACAFLPSSALALREPLPGPLPPSSCVTWPSQCLIQTRNGSFALSSHIVRAGHTLTGTVGGGCMYREGTKPCPVFWDYMKDVGKRVSGCREHDLTCTVRIGKNAPSSAYYVINVGITSDQGTGWSSDYYAVVGKDEAVITGKILNKERQPVAGADVAMFGGSHTTGNYVAESGPDGVYAADVKAGRYRVWPSGRSLSHRTPPKFEPEHRDLKAHARTASHANFTVDIGLVVKLTLSTTNVPADGFQIVQGTIKVTELGQPQPGVTVALWPKASEKASAAVSSGARATVCGPNGRIWPGGTLGSPDGGSVDVQTDSTGQYHFTLDVGTVPGPFAVTAWARDASGNLITHDTLDASDEQTVTVAAIGSHPLDEFVSEYNLQAKSVGVPGISSDPNSIAGAFEGLTRTLGPFKGYAYGVGQGSAPAVVIYPASTPPLIQHGAVIADGTDLVLQPWEWQAVPGAAVTDLSAVLRQGLLPSLPTFSAWAQGNTSANWSGHAQSMQLATQNFQYFGWPYPSSTPGSCG
jgi:hypothetical protein